MDRHVFKQIQGMHKISSDLRVVTMMEHITTRSARKPKPLETWADLTAGGAEASCKSSLFLLIRTGE